MVDVDMTDMPDVDMTDLPDVDLTDLPDVDLTDLPDLDLTDMPDVGVSSAGHSPNKLGIDMRGDTTYHPTGSEAKSHDFLDSSSDFSLTSVSTLDVRDFEGHSPPDLEAEPENDEFFLPQTSANDGTALGGQHNLEFSKYQPDTWPSDTELSDDVGERYLSESKSRPHALYMLDMSAASIAEKIAMQRHLIVSSSGNYTEFASPCRERGASSRRKSSCLPLKKLHRFGQETCLFFRRRLLQRRETTLQKCELTLTSVPEEMDNLVLLFTKHTDFMVTEAVSIYFPSFFENKVMVPQCLLPSNSQETVDIVVCCLTHVTQGHLQGFSKICASAKCCLQTENKVHLAFSVDLAPHQPQCALLSQRNTLLSCRVLVSHLPSSQYHFESKPHPVSTHFIEMMLLQTAAPFQEHFKMVSSTCDSPASFCIDLQPRSYYAVCMYRLTTALVSGVFNVPCAASPIHLKTYADKHSTKNMLERTEAMISGGEATLLPHLFLSKPQVSDLEYFLNACTFSKPEIAHNIRATYRKKHIYLAKNSHLDGLRFAAWDGLPDTKDQYTLSEPSEQVHVPALTIFNVDTRLYFADLWSFYEKHYVTLVLTTPGSKTHKICKKLFCKLDPYSNLFFFRKRSLCPEPSVEVYTSSTVNVEIFYSDSSDITEMLLHVPDQVYVSKLQV